MLRRQAHQSKELATSASAEETARPNNYQMFQRGKTADHDAGEILVKLDFQSKGALHPAHEMAVPQWISQREEISWAVGVRPSWRLTTETLSVYRGGVLVEIIRSRAEDGVP